MQSIADKLKAIGFKESPMLGPNKPSARLLKANADWYKRKRAHRPAAHFQDIGAVIRSSMRNPSSNGSMPNDARLADGAGSDLGRAYKLSPGLVRFGWKAKRGGQSHPDEKRDYWEGKK